MRDLGWVPIFLKIDVYFKSMMFQIFHDFLFFRVRLGDGAHFKTPSLTLSHHLPYDSKNFVADFATKDVEPYNTSVGNTDLSLFCWYGRTTPSPISKAQTQTLLDLHTVVS